jgi:hypothetical protein
VLADAQDKRVTPEQLACDTSMVNPATPKLRVNDRIQMKKIKRASHVVVPADLFDSISAKYFRAYAQTNEDGVPFCIALMKDSDEPDKGMRLGLTPEQRSSLSAAILENLKSWQFDKTFFQGKPVVIEFSVLFEKNKKRKVLELVRN